MVTPILIVGAGQAAAQAVETLRKRGHEGPLTVVGDENLLPYQRPPLSKKYLAGQMESDRLLFRHAAHYQEHQVDLHLGFAAVNLDARARRVDLADGAHFEYQRLLLATGSQPRLLPVPGSELAGVYYLRTLADVDRLRRELSAGRRAVIVGGGYIGLEVAATCRGSRARGHRGRSDQPRHEPRGIARGFPVLRGGARASRGADPVQCARAGTGGARQQQ